MINWMRRALTRTIMLPGQKRGKQEIKYQLPPSEILVYGVALLMVFFVVLAALQVAHMLILRGWSDAIWAGMMVLMGAFVGAFFGGRT